MRVLGIESSCDETAAAVYDASHGLIAHVLHSQIATHRPYGGVVPELASRDHVKKLAGLVDEALHQAHITKHDLDAIAYVAGPGLVGALLSGACFAKSLAYALGKPGIAVHHLEAHILAAMLDNPDVAFPYLSFLVSGGHTQLFVAHAFGEYELLGETLDDAVGEAFDKTAKLMGLAYPGGPTLAKLADECPEALKNTMAPFPRPMTDRPGLDFSFSGLKTHALQAWQKSDKTESARFVIAHAFQLAVVETLLIKCRRAVQQTGIRCLVAAGGVAANQALRAGLQTMMQDCDGEVFFPRPEFCTDNGAMVAYAGYCYLQRQQVDADLHLNVRARWPLGQGTP